ncbi:hypothetical protein GTY54_37685 [Streptomyces sp. SID625]|nr:hypothetical protein [Streptomyces sp. SID625]
MLRIHFTDADYAAVRLREGPDAMWETLLSLHALQQCDEALEFGRWRTEVARELDPVAADSLFPLAPPVGYSPDFLTPAGAEGFGSGLERVLATPAGRMVRELGRLRAPADRGRRTRPRPEHHPVRSPLHLLDQQRGHVRKQLREHITRARDA